jgi:hypothetical protein
MLHATAITTATAAGARVVVTRRASLRYGQHATVSDYPAQCETHIYVRFDTAKRDLLWPIDAFGIAA